jgi:hypothetical protein
MPALRLIGAVWIVCTVAAAAYTRRTIRRLVREGW